MAYVYDMPPSESIIGGGISGVVYALDDFRVLKAASGFNLSRYDLDIERQIYERLHCDQPQILNFESDPRGLILERLSCPLRQYLRYLHELNQIPSDGLLLKWAGQVINGLWHMHSKGVLQANIGCHNLLIRATGDLDFVDLLEKDLEEKLEKMGEGDLKFCDFGGASIDGSAPTVKYERFSRHPTIRGPNIATEIFALGSALYEMSTTESPRPNVQLLGAFPEVGHLILGHIIDGCWRGFFESTLDMALPIQIIRYNYRKYKDPDYEPTYYAPSPESGAS